VPEHEQDHEEREKPSAHRAPIEKPDHRVARYRAGSAPVKQPRRQLGTQTRPPGRIMR
jgi:hypothetical protein